MAVTAISRDTLTQTVSLVRMVASNTLAEITASGYLTAQEDNITALNNGVWEWLSTDAVLVSASDGHQLLSVSSDFTALVAVAGLETVSNGLTALAGGAQAGTALTAQINRVTTVATANDSVQLPAATPGKVIVVVNAAAANQMAVFPQTGENINALSDNASLIMSANRVAVFYCAVATTWNSIMDVGARIFAGTTAAYAGGGTSNAFTVTGLTVNSKGSAVIRASTNAVSICKALPGTNTLTVTFSADPGASTTVDYIYSEVGLS